jgi:hypothetical protein
MIIIFYPSVQCLERGQRYIIITNSQIDPTLLFKYEKNSLCFHIETLFEFWRRVVTIGYRQKSLFVQSPRG